MADKDIMTGVLYAKQLDENNNIIGRIPMMPKTLSDCVVYTSKDNNNNYYTLNEIINKIINGDYSEDIDLSGYVKKSGDTITGDLIVNTTITTNQLSTSSLYIDRQEIDGSNGLTFQVNDNNGFNFNGGNITLESNYKYIGDGSGLTNISANNISGTLPIANISGILPITQGGTGATTLGSDKILQGNGTDTIKSILSVDKMNSTSGITNTTSDTYIPTSAAVVKYVEKQMATIDVKRITVDIIGGYTKDYKTYNHANDNYFAQQPVIGIQGSLVPAAKKGDLNNFEYDRLYDDNGNLYNPGNGYLYASLGTENNRWYSIYGNHASILSLTVNNTNTYKGTNNIYNNSTISNIIRFDIEDLQQVSSLNDDSNYGYGKSNSAANDDIITLRAKSGIYLNGSYNHEDDDTYEIKNTSYIRIGGPFIDISTDHLNISGQNGSITDITDNYRYTIYISKVYNTLIVSGKIDILSGTQSTITIPFSNSITDLIHYPPNMTNVDTKGYLFTCNFKDPSTQLSAKIIDYESYGEKSPKIYIVGISSTNTMYFTFITNISL